MIQNDPTDHALAAIASILDHPETAREPETAEVVVDGSIAAERNSADGYQRVGPGPMAAIRFKWTVRREENGDYYVDETIGENSIPIVTGPMTGDAAVKFVDDRENDARRRFEQIKSEMIGPDPAITTLVGKSDGEM